MSKKNWTFAELDYNRVAHMGHNVSHAKNRTNRSFKYNLHTATVTINGETRKVRVPTKILRQLKTAGLTAHKKVEVAAE